ncbi:MAG: SEC-C domain-containing protein [Clostridia bacterium]|nr:SEC-C domain-containing protein [Clostridia bacterium]
MPEYAKQQIKNLRPQTGSLRPLLNKDLKSEASMPEILEEVHNFFQQKPVSFAEFKSFAGAEYKEVLAHLNGYLRQESKKEIPEVIEQWKQFNQNFVSLTFEKGDEQFQESVRMALAESYAWAGDLAKVEELYDQWLTEDPLWGSGWIGLASVYDLMKNRNLEVSNNSKIIPQAKTAGEKAIKIADKLVEMERNQHNVRRFRELGHIIALLYHEAGHELKADLVLKMAHKPLTSAKVDRNAPCPCGSGKKYKKCCGR